METDLLVVGGGINGAGVARDAAGRGLSVLLVEQGDLAGATSSASSKLIHGGLRYLEHREFRLVREALRERAVLLRIAPHVAWPMRFVLPHAPGGRPAWMLRAGLFLYDRLGGRGGLPRTRRLDLRRAPEGQGLRPELRLGFEYSDAWVDDARLVVLNALDAHRRGAVVRTRTRLLSARREGDAWAARLEDLATGTELAVRARALVNAAGPWVGQVLDGRAGLATGRRPRLVQGSHVVLPRLHAGAHALILPNDDGRVVFVIPWEDRFSLVGTTDVPFEGDPRDVRASAAEVEYLCRAVSRFMARTVTPADVVHTYSGVRALFDDGDADPSAVTRDYVLELDGAPGRPPVLSVFGGKITTYRRLAEHALARLLPLLPAPRPAAWTARAPLPGGDLPDGDFAAFLAQLRARHPWLPEATARRMAHAYGTEVRAVLGDARGPADLGEDFGAGLGAAELAHLVRAEWARTGEDVLWRRTKLGLHLDARQQARVGEAVAALVAGGVGGRVP